MPQLYGKDLPKEKVGVLAVVDNGGNPPTIIYWVTGRPEVRKKQTEPRPLSPYADEMYTKLMRKWV